MGVFEGQTQSRRSGIRRTVVVYGAHPEHHVCGVLAGEVVQAQALCDGRLMLGDDTQVQVGRINLTLADIERATGMSADQISQTLSVTLPQTGLTLDGLEFTDGAAILRGAMP